MSRVPGRWLPRRNRYFALRHGTSLANERGVIVSQPEHGCGAWGLSPAGIDECWRRFAAPDFPGQLGGDDVLVLSSDFQRALDTAEILCAARAIPRARIDVGLRERSFGSLEFEPAERYSEVWRRDREDPGHGFAGVESTGAVALRMLAVIERVEAAHAGKDVVLVSHGDPLQILAAVLAGRPSHRHREAPHWQNAEGRFLPDPAAVPDSDRENH